MKRIVVVAALVAATSTAAADTADDAFRASARAFAKRTNRRVVAWGTARLDGAKPHRFATLRTTDRRALDGHDDVRCSGDKVCRGAYLFEASPGAAKLWLVSFDEDRMPTKPFVVRDNVPAGEPAWVQLDDKGIVHDQLHIGGWQSQTFGLRGGKLVMLQIVDEDRRAVTGVGMDDRVFTNADGTCKRTCPALVSFAYAISDRSQLQIVGPERPDRLVERPLPD